MEMKNIDFLSAGNPCNLDCPGCWYSSEEDSLRLSREGEIALMGKIRENYQGSSFFAYPKEITTSPYLLPFIREIGQKSVLTNGIMLDTIIEDLLEARIGTVKVTLFSSQEEQAMFNASTGKQYERIKRNIKAASDAGLRVQLSNVLDRETAKNIPQLADIASELGASQILFYRLLPLGSNTREFEEKILMAEDMPFVVNAIEGVKKEYPLRFSMSMNFGPNFYGKNIEEAEEKISGKGESSWVKSSTLCPAIDGQYAGISVKSGSIYWCFLLISNPGLSKIGRLDRDTIKIDSPVDLSTETLMKKLRGNCSGENCEYQRICLGGCRATAATMASFKKEKEPLYAGMDICMTKAYQSVFGK